MKYSFGVGTDEYYRHDGSCMVVHGAYNTQHNAFFYCV
jgi:hypothetical protein